MSDILARLTARALGAADAVLGGRLITVALHRWLLAAWSVL